MAKYLHFHLKTSCLASGRPKLPQPFVNVPQFCNLKVITLGPYEGMRSRK